ncbi:Rrf2 family transcriptional regulator [Sutterella sp.]|uniref:Rrf2 family transcriptional regulator n=1 Tax=Sutterella sp. TaxID=1981025 RepID=UPI0026E0326B|nr:Rrf2 family transcriptional regulator [Sutterella sp.]MDO5530959.1 Rrf2 family transcriptional regulator [Sutterella sp.]
MRFTRFTDLSLRVLMYVSARPAGELATVTEIAERIGWSRNHIVKVVHRMSCEGWLRTQRGRSGGLELALPATELRLGDIVRTLEGAEPLVDCAEPLCPMARGCRLPRALDRALEAFYAELNTITLADLASTGDFLPLFSMENVIPIAAERSEKARAEV